MRTIQPSHDALEALWHSRASQADKRAGHEAFMAAYLEVSGWHRTQPRRVWPHWWRAVMRWLR